MSTISNKFFVQVIEDGSTLHGELRATKSLTQAVKGGSCVPDWTVAANQPIIYVTLQNGSSFVLPDNTYKWFYNGTEIEWTGNTSTDGLFQKVTDYTPTGYSAGQYVPAIKIIGNLATANDSVDIDVIRFDGQKTLSTNPVGFSVSINVTIAEWSESGYLGLIEYTNSTGTTSGPTDITSDNLTVYLKGTLLNGDGDAVTCTYKWYLEGDNTIKGTSQILSVTEAMVTDYAVLRCEFYMTINGVNTKVYTAYATVDDTQDPEFMWITHNGQNGSAASLKDGESVTFSIWVGKADDPTYKDTRWSTFKAKFIDSTGSVIYSALANFAAISGTGDGYRTLPVSSNVATAVITYDDVFTKAKKGLTGYVLAQTS